jgi:predicted RNase H-like HicB family nuclease
MKGADHPASLFCVKKRPGKTEKEALESLSQAVKLILDDRREEGLRGIPPDALVERISIT